MNAPKVGVGVLIFKDKAILLGKRISSHGAGTWAPPGGYLEFGETFEDCAIREIKRAIGITLFMPEYLAVTNDLFDEDEKHDVTVFMCANFPEGKKIKNLEPDQTSEWEWFNLKKLPENLFLPLQNLIGEDGLDLLISLTEAGDEEQHH